MNESVKIPTSAHWGNYQAELKDGALSAIKPAASDTHPSPIGQSLLDSQHKGARIPRPCIRQGYLGKRWRSDGAKRGIEPFVAVPWDEALDIAAESLRHTIDQYGNGAIFGGSYGWSSAGRFHHAQSQLHRFLKQAGGYVSSRHSYSTGTAQVIIPYVMGVPSLELCKQSPPLEDVVANAKLVVGFGGFAMKNTQINQGGVGAHSAREQLLGLRDAGVDVVCVSPVKNDVAEFLKADWWPVRPNSDVALMLGLAHTLHTEALHDRAFLADYCVGYEKFVPYLTGASDGIAKDAEWASQLCDIDPERIRRLARTMASEPCLLSISWSLQRTEHGDQPYWMISVLGAMLGHIGKPGLGVGYGYGCLHNYGFAGRTRLPFKVADFPQGENRVEEFIPCARIADLLLHPEQEYTYHGTVRRYPDIKLVYWAGGNPFHHHQDLNRLRKAWTRPETIIVNEMGWTATARNADIVFPSTTALEREDFAWGVNELWASPMHQVLPPFEDARDDYSTFSGLAERLGFAETFTEGRSPREWVQHMWATTVENAREHGIELPGFQAFWAGGPYSLDPQEVPAVAFDLERYRADPSANPLPTPSGKIEIYSETVQAYGLSDTKAHPEWLDKEEFIGSERSRTYPLALNSNQPATKLHSQFDFGRTSTNAKIEGRERIQMHPQDAADRQIKAGDIVRVFNDRGATLAAASFNKNVRPGVVVLPTGAWYDPEDPNDPLSLEVHGNPNVLTRDIATSTLAQGTSAHSTLVEVEKFESELPPIKVFDQPPMAER